MPITCLIPFTFLSDFEFVVYSWLCSLFLVPLSSFRLFLFSFFSFHVSSYPLLLVSIASTRVDINLLGWKREKRGEGGEKEKEEETV